MTERSKIKFLNADELGEKGESRFREICADANMICNASNRDRTGWDFIVEFPFQAPSGQMTLDKRGPPISAHIQVKTMWQSNDKIRLRLSAAERLAKEPKPTFIYALKVNEKLEFPDAYLVHVLQDNLATILKRLRKEHAKGIAAINKKTIVLDVCRLGQRILPTGEALRTAISANCGPDIQSYIDRKTKQLKGLGFDAAPYSAKMNFQMEVSEGVDAFLGLKEIKVSSVKTFETRFGITLPFAESKNTDLTLQIKPQARGTCKIIVRADPESAPAIINAEIFFLPLPKNLLHLQKLLIKSEFCQLQITFGERSETVNVELNTDTNWVNSNYSIREWIHFLRALVAIKKGRGSITIKGMKGLFFKFPIPSIEPDHEGIEVFEYSQRVCKRIRHALRSVEIENPEIDISEIINFGTTVGEWSPLFERGRLALPEANGLWISFLTLGSTTFAYYVLKLGSGSPSRRESDDVHEVTELRNFPIGYQSFVERAKATSGFRFAIVRQPDGTFEVA